MRSEDGYGAPEERYSPEGLERLSGNSERTPFWGPKSLQKGVKRHLINAPRYRNNALTDPSGYFPGSLSTHSGEYGQEEGVSTAVLKPHGRVVRR